MKITRIDTARLTVQFLPPVLKSYVQVYFAPNTLAHSTFRWDQIMSRCQARPGFPERYLACLLLGSGLTRMGSAISTHWTLHNREVFPGVVAAVRNAVSRKRRTTNLRRNAETLLRISLASLRLTCGGLSLLLLLRACDSLHPKAALVNFLDFSTFQRTFSRFPNSLAENGSFTPRTKTPGAPCPSKLSILRKTASSCTKRPISNSRCCCRR